MGLFDWLYSPKVKINASDTINQANQVLSTHQAVLHHNITQQQQLFFQKLKVVMADAGTTLDSFLRDIDSTIAKQRQAFLTDVDTILNSQRQAISNDANDLLNSAMRQTQNLVDTTTTNALLATSRLPFSEKDPVMLKFFSEIIANTGVLSIKFRGYFPTSNDYTYYLTIGEQEDVTRKIVLSPIIQEPQLIDFELPLDNSEESLTYMSSKQSIRLPIKLTSEKKGWLTIIETQLCKTFIHIVSK